MWEPDELDDLHAERVETREEAVERGLVGHDAAQLRLRDRTRRTERLECCEDVRAQPTLDPERTFEAHAGLPRRIDGARWWPTPG